MKMQTIDEIFEREGIGASCTCECGCTCPTVVLTEEQRYNNQCGNCHYSHR